MEALVDVFDILLANRGYKGGAEIARLLIESCTEPVAVRVLRAFVDVADASYEKGRSEVYGELRAERATSFAASRLA